MGWKVDWTVLIDGKDLTSKMRPFLMNIEVTDAQGEESDHCSLKFDDAGGKIKLPAKGAAIEVLLDGIVVFRGCVDSVRSNGSRGGGRILMVSAKSFDTRGPAKSEQMFHKDDATLEEFLGEAASNAGFTLKVDPALASDFREYWMADGESFMVLGHRLAREYGATFKLRDKVAVFVPRGAESGLTPVDAIVGDGGNVVNWDIEPFTGWPAAKKVKARWFDRSGARFEEKEVSLDVGENVTAETTMVARAADGGHADTLLQGRESDAENNVGGGSIELDLTPHARAEARLNLSGARRGIDGAYRITSVTHRADRSNGAITRCEVSRPGNGAGVDERKAG